MRGRSRSIKPLSYITSVNWDDLTEEEKSVLRLTLVFLAFGVVFKVMFMFCPVCPALDLLGTVGLGFGAGSTAGGITSHITRRIKERKVKNHFDAYSGAWKRKSLYQYSYLTVDEKGQVKMAPRQRTGSAVSPSGDRLPENQVVDERSISITYKGGRTLELRVDYDPATRGTVKGQVEFDADRGIVGVGTYLYVAGPLLRDPSNDGLPHSGKYTLHLFPSIDRDLMYVYYDGLQPSPDARGYEVWQRDRTGPHHLSWDSETA